MVRGQRGACRRLRAGTAVLEPGGTRRATVAAADGAGVPRAPGCPRLGPPRVPGTALGGTAAAAIAAVVAPPFGLWRSFDEWDADYRTDTGGRRQFGLDRQVQVDMNTQTSIALRPDVAGALGMELITGEAAFEALAPDRSHGAGRRRRGQRQPGEVRAASHRQQRLPDLRQRRGRAVARGRRTGPGAAPAGQLRPRAGGRDPDDRPR